MARDRNYSQFFALLKQMESASKEDLVRTYTNGRTDSLRAMSALEYRAMIGAMQRITTNREELRKARSATLRLMQRYGVNTCDWERVNSFCGDKRIAGKAFAQITIPEHVALQRKLRAMMDKGYQRTQPASVVALPNLNNTPS